MKIILTKSYKKIKISSFAEEEEYNNLVNRAVNYVVEDTSDIYELDKIKNAINKVVSEVSSPIEVLLYPFRNEVGRLVSQHSQDNDAYNTEMSRDIYKNYNSEDDFYEKF